MSSTSHVLAAIGTDSFLMYGLHFAHPKWLFLAWTAPLFAIVLGVFAQINARKLHLIADVDMITLIAGTRRRWNMYSKSITTMCVVVLMSIALAQPQSDPREVSMDARGRDVVFLVDVSRSMLTKDVSPNRLDKSKLWINDLVDELGNDRVGLVAFAGSSAVLSPLTTDRLFFRLALEELSPQSITVGGTNIGDAIRKTMDMVFVETDSSTENNFRDLVLISDGEDQESLPIEAARVAGLQGVRIIAIGIGSSKGAAVPMESTSGSGSQPVRSKLESSTLRAIAAASPGGVYLEVGTGTVDLAQVYRDLIASASQRTIETTTHIQFTEMYMYFIAAALIFIFIDLMIPTSNRKALS